jgi:hypothetical protein
MRSSSRRTAAALAAFCCLAARGARAEVVERILAVVDDAPILFSDVRATASLKRVDEAAALELLIDERLMLREAARLPEAAVEPEAEEQALRGLRKTASVAPEIGEGQLRRIARRQLLILRYVEFRFRPQLRVGEDQLRRAYDAELNSRLDAPGFEAAEPELRARLLERALSERIEAWVKELRAGAVIRYNER